MSKRTVNSITPDGIHTTGQFLAADVAGDSVDAANGVFICVQNGDASPKTVTVASPIAEASAGDYGKVPVPDIVVNIPAGEERSFSIPSGFADAGVWSWTYSDVTSVLVGCFKVNSAG